MLKIRSIRPKKVKKPFLVILELAVILCIGSAIGYASCIHQQTVPSQKTSSPQPSKKSATSSQPATLPPISQTTPPSTPASIPPLATKPATTPCAGTTISKLLLVSISLQHMWACETDTLVNQAAVTTGMTRAPNNVDDATPTGSWQIYSKQTNQRLRGSDRNGSWDDFVQYWIPFDGPIGFHDASWQTFPFGSSQYQTDGSHGCVHLPLDVIAWIYNWAPIGTVVTIEK